MRISRDTFRDEQMRSEIDGNSIYEIGYFDDFFVELLSQFEKSPSGRPVYEIIQDDWDLFAEIDTAKTVVEYYIAKGGLDFSVDDAVNYSSDIVYKIDSWSRLKDDVRWRKRFLADYDEFSQYAYLVPEAGLKRGDKLFRARILPNNMAKYAKREMGCPPPELSMAGRANPAGIPYLYLCADENTTYYEVRATYLDRLCIGTFKIERDLKIVDFNTKVSLYLAYSDGVGVAGAIVGKLIMDEISRDMSRPMRRYDSEQEYIPTQMICEFCKLVVGADGVTFKSSVYGPGRNYVLFKKDDAKCTKVITREINSVVISA